MCMRPYIVKNLIPQGLLKARNVLRVGIKVSGPNDRAFREEGNLIQYGFT